jgi:L-asparagine transporter-like permease
MFTVGELAQPASRKPKAAAIITARLLIFFIVSLFFLCSILRGYHTVF